MFVSHKLSPSKKNFQKPNILRRKSKVTAMKSGPCKPSPASTAGPKLPADTARNNTVEDWSVSTFNKMQLELLAEDVACRPSEHPAATSVGTQDIHSGAVVHVQVMDTEDQETIVEETPVDETQHKPEQEVVDVEAFLNGSRSTQYKTQYEAQSKLENSTVQKWQIDLENETYEIVMEPFNGLREMPQDKLDADLASPDCALGTGNFKCVEPDRPTPPPPTAAAATQCPAGGCGRVFAARDQLARHLKEDHGPDDALHGCEECGRRFFWAVGLRAHARAHAAPGAMHHCLWPGCGRAFRQPCRLREHARAHTGDRPYRCKHPGCPWAFRTASKLLRHARRHTGERRHACACGRAFRRREHLREHQARHRRGMEDGDSTGSGTGRRVRSRVPALPGTAGVQQPGAAVAAAPAPAPALHDEFMVRVVPLEAGAAACERDGAPASEEGRAARTHCTWPLAPPAALAATEEPACCVRSDLFLAVPDEDSHGMIPGAGSAEPALEAASPLPPLGLLDYMQEELMYTDAVDESSFQVLLLNEELG